MNLNPIFVPFRAFLMPIITVSILLVFASQALAQNQGGSQQRQGPVVQLPSSDRGDSGIGRTNLQCSGYFRMPPLNGLPQIVGAEEEQEQTVFATGDYVYLDAGSRQGIRQGQEFHILRPRGEIEHVYRQKKGDLGVFVDELGQLQVIQVKEAVSVAQITFSCDVIRLGDLLTGVPDRATPTPRQSGSLDRFSDATGKPGGRVMMARDGREMVTSGDLIYVDIGDEDKVVPGDYVTIYRRVGTGNLNVRTYENANGSERGFASEHYRGGELSIDAPRAKDDQQPGMYRGSPILPSEIKHRRPEPPRKIVGEAMIINVQVRTATAIITRVAQEVHTGDFVELR